MMTRVSGRGALALTLAIVGFSMTGIWVRWLAAMDPLAVTAGRGAVALGVLVPAAWLTVDRAAAVQHLRSARVHGLAVRMSVFFALAVAAFQVVPVSMVVLMVGVAPAWILIFERLDGAVLDPWRAAGVGLALFGAGLALAPSLAAGWGDHADPSAAWGVLAGLGAGFFNAAFVFGRSRLAARGIQPDGFVLAAITSAWTLGLWGIAGAAPHGALGPTTPFEWGALAGLGVISTAAPLWGLATASRLLPPLLVAFITPLLPFTAALAAWLLLGEAPPVAFAWGSPWVLAGIGLVVWPRR